MAEANLIPGATQVFADVLEGGSVKKLFDNMQKGKYDLQDIVKVLDSLESKLKKDVLSKMFSKPSVAMNDFRTALTRFWEEVNAAGGSDMMIGVLTAMADALKGATKWMKDNKETIDSWVKGLKIVGKVLWEIVPALLAIWGLKKVFNILGMFQSVSARTLITRLLTGNMGAMWLTMLFGAGGAGGLGARIGAGLVKAMKIARFVVIAAIPLLIAGVADDIYTAMIGGESLIGAAAKSDNPFAKWISRAILGAFEIGKSAFVNFFALFDLLFVSRDWGKFTGVIKENALELRNWMMKNFGELIPDSLIHAAQYISMLFSSVMGNFTTLMQSQDMLRKGNVVGAFGNLSNLTTPDKIPSFEEYRKSLAAKPITMPTSVPTPITSQYRPDPLGLRTQPNVNIEINATGVSAEELSKIVQDQYIQNTRAMVLGASVNYQGGK